MFNINVTSKAVIVATTLAVISFSALESNAEEIDLLTDVIQSYDTSEQEIRDYLQHMLDEDDVNCLARNIYYESRGEPIEGQKWVAWVTINRMNHDNYPHTICRVVHQCNKNNVCQFSWVASKRNSIPREQDSWERSVEIAANVLIDHEFEIEDDPTNGAIMFHADHVSPRWRHSYELVDKIGSLFFYTDES